MQPLDKSDRVFGENTDGMEFNSNGLLWIQTDDNDRNEGEFAGLGNNQMLIGDPDSGEITCFLTDPNDSVVTGITWSADRRVTLRVRNTPSTIQRYGVISRSEIKWRETFC